MNYKELYDTFKIIGKKEYFKYDDENQKITIQIPIKSEDLIGLDIAIRDILGDEIYIEPQGGTGEWRINPDFIKLDNDTIGVNKYGGIKIKDEIMESINKIDVQELSIEELRNTCVLLQREINEIRNELNNIATP
jgi:hypothetical protein